ncbi:MAG TPA: FCD domain-containing protein [Pseudonocardiaceae bacterium]|jgi:DNA-binding FadR family transcriptional regulator|nr:FCD domain-containing protein [Pseudonocardiaceae bacterium]
MSSAGPSSTGSASVASVDEALLRPVRAGNAFEETVERLLRMIKLGVIGVGQRLPTERELSVRLGVARATLREAIHALADAGYVRSRRGRYGGTFVSEPQLTEGSATSVATSRSAEEVADVLVMREVLETGAAVAAAGRALDPEQRRHLRDQLAETSAAELGEYRRKDSRLHLAIAEVTGSPSLTTAVADARMRVNSLLDEIPLLPRNIEHSNAQHEAIVAGILGGDQDSARRAMTEHLAGTAALLRGFLA